MVNVKRESKLYSYDVQMDMLAAQKQRERQMKLATRSATTTEASSLLAQLKDQLTDKQLEAVRAELAAEKDIRERTLAVSAFPF